jgi:glutamate/tyrosine decarboxylase-like PLP-dependent enzyme
MTSPGLFPVSLVCEEWDDYLTAVLASASLRVPRGQVTPTVDRRALRADLDAFDFQAPVPFGELVNWVIARMEDGVVHMNHPRYLGLFNPAPSFPAKFADRIVASFNPQLATATTSPAAVEIEAHVARMVAARTGLPPGAVGHFTSGGSEANYTALICALTRAHPDFAGKGARAFTGQPVFYISADSHLAWIKIAHQAGIGRDAARLVPTDGMGRMSVEVLSALLRADIAEGRVPVMIVATAGTTNAGMIDPLEDCGTLARKYGLWYHVDAAWGGGLIASGRSRGRLAGIERASSVTIDAHKWFATTMGCGMILIADPTVPAATFNVRTSFMPSHTPDIDPYVTTAQWSRRFLGLRLFMALGAVGWAGYEEHVEHAILLARDLASAAARRGWSVVNDPALAVVCLTPPAGSPPVKEIVARVLATGDAWISAARFEGQDVVRACITNGETSGRDIAVVVDLLEQARAMRAA